MVCTSFTFGHWCGNVNQPKGCRVCEEVRMKEELLWVSACCAVIMTWMYYSSNMLYLIQGGEFFPQWKKTRDISFVPSWSKGSVSGRSGHVSVDRYRLKSNRSNSDPSSPELCCVLSTCWCCCSPSWQLALRCQHFTACGVKIRVCECEKWFGRVGDWLCSDTLVRKIHKGPKSDGIESVIRPLLLERLTVHKKFSIRQIKPPLATRHISWIPWVTW